MKAFPFDSHVTYDQEGAPIFDRAINSKVYRYIFRELFKSGIMPNPSTNLQVTTGEGMNVIVLPGFAMVDGCMSLEEENRTLAVQASESQYDRIDTVVLRLNANDSYRLCDLYVVEGVPSSNPVRPDLTREGDIYEIGLADLYISKNSSVISEARITDTRYEAERCGVISSISEFDTSTLDQQMNQWSKEKREEWEQWQADEQQDFTEWRTAEQNDFKSWRDTEEADFIAWVEWLKTVLDESAAGHLQQEIDEIRSTTATADRLGLVKVDNMTIKVKEDGTIYATIGALLTVSTQTATFEGLTLTARGTKETVQGTFHNGICELILHYLDTYTLSITNVDGRTYTETSTVTALGQLLTNTINEHFATVNITTESEELASASITVKKDGVTVDTIAFVDSAVTYKIYDLGNYNFSVVVEGETFETDINITELDKTYATSIDTLVLRKYEGTVPTLSNPNSLLVATTVGDYALFGGGEYQGTKRTDVSAFDSLLTRHSVSGFSYGTRDHAATTIGDYALFGGGNNTNENPTNRIEIYDKNLTKQSYRTLTSKIRSSGATTVGNYAIFAGGESANGYSSEVCALNDSFVRSNPSSLSAARRYIGATTVGNYAIFAGGQSNEATTNYYSAKIDAYDNSLTRTVAQSTLEIPRAQIRATTVGNYALFGGGHSSKASSVSTVDAMDDSLTRVTCPSLKVGVYRHSATTVGHFALFGGGYDAVNNIASYEVTAIDSSLVKYTDVTLLTKYCSEGAAATIGHYALFMGGGANSHEAYYGT